MHIIFNSEYQNTNGQEFFESLPNAIQEDCIEIATTKEFKTVIGNLATHKKVQVWVHIGALQASKMELPGMIVKFSKNAVEFLDKNNIEYRKITRGSERAHQGEIVFTSYMKDAAESLKKYRASELNNLLTQLLPNEDESPTRRRLKDNYSNEIRDFNSSYSEFELFIDKMKENWYSLLRGNSNIFNSKYWYFESDIVKNYLSRNNERIIDENSLDVAEGIIFDLENKLWQIDCSFFDAVSRRFEDQNDEYSDNLKIATRLFIIHEAIHKHHKLDSNSVSGIGNFPRIVEFLDYQADAVAFLLELSFQIERNDISSSKDVINCLKKVIKVAVETTFSFNPVLNNYIQIRRVNRYNQWIFIYVHLEQIQLKNLSFEGSLNEIYALISNKPLIELSGPAIISDNNRVFFDLSNYSFIKEFAYLNNENVLKRGGETTSFSIEDVFSGYINASFKELYDSMSKLLT